MKFFVSYSGRELKWAKWIVWELENARQRYQCTVQFRDFAPGMSFIRKMREAAELDCTLALFSESYFRSDYCNRELDAALTGKTLRLLPVMVEPCDPGTYLHNVIHIDLTQSSRDESRELLLSGVDAYVTQTLGKGKGLRFQKTRPMFPREQAAPERVKVSIPAPAGPLKVLFIGPQVGGLDPRGQVKAMQDAVKRARYSNSVTFKALFKAEISTLFEGLNREVPDVFHFSGKQSGGDILMRTESGGMTTVPDTALGGVFRSLDHRPTLVIIDTCYSLRCATTIARAVPCAIGVEGDPYEEDAVLFFSVLYQAFASGRSVKDAMGQAQSALKAKRVAPNCIPQLRHRPDVDPGKLFLVRR